jgi:hypothetical protein
MPDDEIRYSRNDLIRMNREDRDILVASQIAELSANMNSALKRLDEIEKQAAIMVAMANRWKGATFILLGLGSCLGWLISIWGRVGGHL